MATGALQHGSPAFFHRPMRLAEVDPHSLPAPCEPKAPVTQIESRDLLVSRATALGAARSAMLALGIEAVAGLGIYGIWSLARLLGL
ncbi:MAG TPA: hypothetical protein VMU48_17195 [Terracidiphilus sp.]|nr:hypothetical protein [Terracidiphilus sp.]